MRTATTPSACPGPNHASASSALEGPRLARSISAADGTSASRRGTGLAAGPGADDYGLFGTRGPAVWVLPPTRTVSAVARSPSTVKT